MHEYSSSEVIATHSITFVNSLPSIELVDTKHYTECMQRFRSNFTAIYELAFYCTLICPFSSKSLHVTVAINCRDQVLCASTKTFYTLSTLTLLFVIVHCVLSQIAIVTRK